MTPARRILLPFGAIVALGVAGYGLAQIEGKDRGVPPIDSSANFEVGGIAVDVSGRTADQARTFGWRLAQRRGWKQLWARVNARPADEAPSLSDGQLDGIVAGIAVEQEEIGPRRYLARLGVLFDRGRSADFLGGRALGPRSAPTLVIPVLWQAGTPLSFERRNDWQRAWARFRSGGSPIDYIRPYGTGLDPLVLNVAQAGRPGRGQWRRLLDQYAASDVVVPTVTLQRRWPGGPVAAHFVAVHGVDGEVLAEFDLLAPTSDALPRMLDEGVRRLDLAYAQALRTGNLAADSSLAVEPVAVAPAAEEPAVEEDAGPAAAAPDAAVPPPAAVQTLTLQADTPDAAADAQAEAAVRAVPGVSGVTTASLAIGGVSLLRVQYAGDLPALRAALTARGLRVDEAGGALRLRRPAQ